MSENEKRLYNCKLCKKHNKEGRICFLDGERHEFIFDDVDFSDPVPKRVGEIKKIFDRDTIFELISIYKKVSPDMPVYEILSFHFRDVCIKSLVDFNDSYYIQLESFCSEYGVLPEEGAVLDQANIVLDIFQVIRSAKNEYDIKKQDEMKKKMERESKKGNKTYKTR